LEKWIPSFRDRITTGGKELEDETIHLALEFAVGSLVVDKYGLQLWDLIFLYGPAKFVERVVKSQITTA
jgi:hypothetical protein